jgi:hypothetical protein
MTAPRYRAVEAAEIPRIRKDGCEIALLAGEYGDVKGATPDLYVPVLYMLVAMESGAAIRIPTPASHNAAAYVFNGKADFGGRVLESGTLGHFPLAAADAREGAEASDYVEAAADSETGASFLFIAGQALGEPIAWGGPIVMNTREELRKAFAEYDEGTFIKTRWN